MSVKLQGKKTSYLCECCGHSFNEHTITMDIAVITPDVKVAFIIDEDELSNGRCWRDILDKVSFYGQDIFANYGNFSTAIANAAKANPEDAVLKHLATNYPFAENCATFRLNIEYLD